MVFIKKIEIYGFKSFGFKNTIINFNNGLVAVTGPNGSGKSNVLDAIMFSLGENSPKSLRVDKFQSLFHDTQNKGHRLIRVSVTFDNKDRDIPINADHVTLTREMEGSVGDSQYFLNGKKVTKSTITELLQIVVAVPNKLNIVQQGMITRISELNSDERRKIIEDIVGLSYFDEKKEESLTQLEESDRRLDIALARIGEIRKRIDDLEIERNEQLRFEHIEADVKKYKAIKISNEIKRLENTVSRNDLELDRKNTKSSELSLNLKELREEIEKLDVEKIEFIKQVDTMNKQKAEVSNKISLIVYEVEKLKAIYKQTVSRIAEIKNRLKSIDGTFEDIDKKIDHIEEIVNIIEMNIEKLNDEKKQHINLLKKLDQNIVIENNKNAEINSLKSKIENRNSKLINLYNNLERHIVTNQEKLQIKTQHLNEIYNKINILNSNITNCMFQISHHKNKLKTQLKERDTIARSISNLEDKIKKYGNELENSRTTLDESDQDSIKFQEKHAILVNSMAEDFTISEILKNKNLDTIGTVHDLIKWDKNYHRSVIATASEWMKAIVVRDAGSMIKIAEFAKSKKLPRVKIIPLDLIKSSDKVILKEDNIGIIGHLSNFVTSDFKVLVEFLFGNTIVVRTAKDAYTLSINGYKTVSIEGELFGARSTSLLIDYNSKIIDVVKEINLDNDIKTLRNLILNLKKLLDNKILKLKKVVKHSSEMETMKIKLDNSINHHEEMLKFNENHLDELQNDLDLQINSKKLIEMDTSSITEKIYKNEIRFEIVSNTKKKIQNILSEIDANYNSYELNNLNTERTNLQTIIDSKNYEIQDLTIKTTSQRNDRELYSDRKSILEEEKRNLEKELEDKASTINLDKEIIENKETDLKTLRDQEQEIINASGNSYSILQTYEEKIKSLLENERRVSREYNSFEREIALLDKENSNLREQQGKLNNDLIWLGYKQIIEEDYDVDELVTELSEEYDSLKNRINLRANESYIQVIEGYRGMSERKNDLEKERNSIILFIEEINKEKESMFMDAFLKINQDINHTFSTVIGGNSWLEIENQEEVFSGGVRLVVQFPGKPRRDSTALSGGEKTMAATVFLLALQSIKPSPFYLMDEIDAHLDAQNTERLSRILFERARKNQIIMVTLKDSTISKVDQIYGVYPKNGVSQILKYKYPGKSSGSTEIIA
ncbi:MAG: chromosome segregation SMC family protein [Nitrososphaeraceae archaeon]